jgi:hypothetical protein
MRTHARHLALSVALAFVMVSGIGLAFSHTAPNANLPAPHVDRFAGGASPPSVSAAVPASAPAAVEVSAPDAVGAASSQCQTPGGVPNWQSASFFTDAAVTFWTPGSPSLSGQNFKIVPCNNVIPTYTNGFWMNVTTNVALSVAKVTIWGTGWPSPNAPSPDIKGFSPATPTQLSMFIAPPFYRTASFYFNDYRYFWPGSQVYFNLTLSTTEASPSTIYSASTVGGTYEPIQWSGGFNNATWGFYVASPFAPTSPGNTPVNFSNIIAVTTSPSVLSAPVFEPNPKQTLQIFLDSLNFSSAPAIAIPAAQGTFHLEGGVVGTYYQNFGPGNHTHMELTQPLGPYPDTQVTFNMTCWVPWEGGAIDRIYSPTYTFNWSHNGSWWDPTGGVLNNLILSSSPDVTSTATGNLLATGTPVNISVHSAIQNVTLSSAELHFRYVDTNGVTFGTLPMLPANWNTSYVIVPGLPPSAGLVFSVVAKDIYGNPISSGNYSYTEKGALAVGLPPGYGLFFFEAIDLATGQLVPSLDFTVSNDTWSETSHGYVLGFANPQPVSGSGYLPTAFGTYVVTVRAFGQTQTWTGTVSTQNPFVVVFYLASQSVPPTYAAPVPSLTIPAVVGLLGAAVMMVPISSWFKERRRKAEAEQRRITL